MDNRLESNLYFKLHDTFGCELVKQFINDLYKNNTLLCFIKYITINKRKFIYEHYLPLIFNKKYVDHKCLVFLDNNDMAIKYFVKQDNNIMKTFCNNYNTSIKLRMLINLLSVKDDIIDELLDFFKLKFRSIPEGERRSPLAKYCSKAPFIPGPDPFVSPECIIGVTSKPMVVATAAVAAAAAAAAPVQTAFLSKEPLVRVNSTDYYDKSKKSCSYNPKIIIVPPSDVSHTDNTSYDDITNDTPFVIDNQYSAVVNSLEITTDVVNYEKIAPLAYDIATSTVVGNLDLFRILDLDKILASFLLTTAAIDASISATTEKESASAKETAFAVVPSTEVVIDNSDEVTTPLSAIVIPEDVDQDISSKSYYEREKHIYSTIKEKSKSDILELFKGYPKDKKGNIIDIHNDDGDSSSGQDSEDTDTSPSSSAKSVITEEEYATTIVAPATASASAVPDIDNKVDEDVIDELFLFESSSEPLKRKIEEPIIDLPVAKKRRSKTSKNKKW